CLSSPDDHELPPHTAHARLLPPRPRAPSMRLGHSGSRESRHSLITNDFTSPSRMNGSSLEKASACSRVLKIAMLPPSVNGPMPSTTPRATYLSTTILWRGYTAMIASRLAPEDSPMTTAFMRFLRSGFLARFASSASAAAVPSRRRCDALGRVPLAKRVPMRLPDDASRCTRTPGMSRAVHGVGSMPLLCLKVSEIRSSPLPPEPARLPKMYTPRSSWRCRGQTPHPK